MALPAHNWHYVEVKNDALQPDPWVVGPFRKESAADDFITETEHLIGIIYNGPGSFSFAKVRLRNPRDFIENEFRRL